MGAIEIYGAHVRRCVAERSCDTALRDRRRQHARSSQRSTCGMAPIAAQGLRRRRAKIAAASAVPRHRSGGKDPPGPTVTVRSSKSRLSIWRVIALFSVWVRILAAPRWSGSYAARPSAASIATETRPLRFYTHSPGQTSDWRTSSNEPRSLREHSGRRPRTPNPSFLQQHSPLPKGCLVRMTEAHPRPMQAQRGFPALLPESRFVPQGVCASPPTIRTLR